MKRLLCLILCLMLPLCALAEEIAPLSEEDFTLTIGETVYPLGEDPAPLLAALETLTGAPLTMAESISCMFDGMDREYENEAVLVGTYPIGKNGGDAIESVWVCTDDLATQRGATIGMTREEITALYGEDYFLDWTTMVYSTGVLEPQIMFILDEDLQVVESWMLFRSTTA